jgi:GT2 family glycosyltransferase
VWNQLPFTKDCVDSIIKNTAAGYRLIIVDNASGAETKKYLETLKGAGGAPVELINNTENLGFVKAVNQGIRSSGADHVCVLNNDTIVAKGALEEMIRIADSAKDIGIVNPSSNNLGQRPSEGEPIELYAERISAEAGRYVELGAAIGFCMLIKRAVFDKIGLFDEIYGMGNFEDTDFSRKAIKEGFRCVRACGAYVYHRENTSFKKLKSFDSEFNRNREIYEFRWGKPKRIAYVLDSYNENDIKRVNMESLKLARNGDWVSYISREAVEAPPHSNITASRIDAKHFYLAALFRILKKKKKYNEIVVSDERFGRVLENLAFLHRARVRYD